MENEKKINRLTIPLAILFFILFVIPFILLFCNSFLTYQAGQVEPDLPLTLSNYLKFFKDSYYFEVIIRTFWISIVTTVICTLMAYPLAYFMANAKGYVKTTLLVLVVLPLISGVMVQTMGWYGMLTNYGTVNAILLGLNIIDTPIAFLGTPVAIIIGLIQGFLPFMVLPIMNSIQAIPNNVIEAAENFGANGLQRFFRIILPLSRGGIGAGAILVFGACLSSYTTPSILGRGKVQVIGTVIYQQAMQLFNWPFASVIAVMLLIILLLLTTLSSLKSRRREAKG